MDDEILNLQEELMHQGQNISRMSEELYTQQKEIAALREKLTKIEHMLKSQGDDGSGIRHISEETPPPHY